MFKTRIKPCGQPYGQAHPVRNQGPAPRKAWAQYRRDKTSLSGRLHRFIEGVLKHRPRSGVGRIMARAGARASRPPGRAKASQQATRPAIAGAGHRLHSITPPGRPWPPAAAPGQHHTAPPDPGLIRAGAVPLPPHSSASTSKQPARPSLAQGTGCTRSRHRAGHGHQRTAPGQHRSAAEGGAMGEPFSRSFPCLSIASRGRATPGTRQRAPGLGFVSPPATARAKGKEQGKAWGKNERLKGLNVCE